MGTPIKTPVRGSVTVDVPEAAFQADVPLTAATRGGHVESLHRGTVVVATTDGELLVAAGEPSQRVYMRSSAKPFQAMALVLTGAADHFDLSNRDLAIASASHSGQREHVEAVLGLLAKAGLGPELLRCGAHPPIDSEAARRLASNGKKPDPVHNNCSGKHAAMLVVCAHMGWPLDSYRSPSHPLQRLNRETVAAFSGIVAGDIDLAVDGCGVPVFHVTVLGVATAFARLATGALLSAEHGAAALRVREAMTSQPFLVGGSERFDTTVMEATGGAVVCKGGAQGGEGLGIPHKEIGIGIKISDGSSASIPVVAYHVLSVLGALSDLHRSALARYEREPLRNHSGELVGRLEAVFTMGA